MKSTPILFSGPMVQAILQGRKTQTRRVVNNLLRLGKAIEFQQSDTKGYDWQFRNKRMLWNDISNQRLMGCCPYGLPGDELWVRETFRYDDYNPDTVIYRADLPHSPEELKLVKWKPSIFMPKKHCRLWLEVTGVRVERVQDISEEDAKAEGVQSVSGCEFAHPLECFYQIWEEINGKKYPWSANPYVWVVEFKTKRIIETNPNKI